MKELMILIFSLPLIILGQVQVENKEIKLSVKKETKFTHFITKEYVLSFPIKDMNLMSKDLKFSHKFKKQDTLDLYLFIKKIDSLGKGNLINNFKLNNKFMDLIDKGKVKVYSKNKSSELFKLNKYIEGTPMLGKLIVYKNEGNTVVQFFEAYIGCPSF